MAMAETFEQAGSRHLQALLINPLDGFAMHNMIKSFTAAVKADPSTATSISRSLDAAGRTLCAAAMQSQALISSTEPKDKLRYGIDSIRRIRKFYQDGYEGLEDVGYWKHNILRPPKQLDLVIEAYVSVLKTDPEAVRDYSVPLIVEFRDLWRPDNLASLKDIFDVLKQGGADTQGKANLLLSEVATLKKQLS